MTRSRLLLAVAGVLAAAAGVFVVLGAAFNLILLAAAVPFGAAAYFLWADATGRLHRRFRWRTVGPEADARWRRADGSARTDGRSRASRARPDDGAPTMGREEALATLDLPPDADQLAVRRAYRDRVKAVHPDADDGDEDAFRHVRAAYERLTRPRRGKG